MQEQSEHVLRPLLNNTQSWKMSHASWNWTTIHVEPTGFQYLSVVCPKLRLYSNYFIQMASNQVCQKVCGSKVLEGILRARTKQMAGRSLLPQSPFTFVCALVRKEQSNRPKFGLLTWLASLARSKAPIRGKAAEARQQSWPLLSSRVFVWP